MLSIQKSFADLLVQSKVPITSDLAQKFTQRYLTVVCRLGKHHRYSELAKKMGIAREARETKNAVMKTQLGGSRFWRAIWFVVAGGMDVRAAAKKQRCSVRDVCWAVENLTRRQRTILCKLSQEPWVMEPDYNEIRHHIMTTKPYCRSACGRLQFVTKYDPATSRDEFTTDALCAALSAAYQYDGRDISMNHLRNLAWRSAANFVNSSAKFHGAASRQRVQRTEVVPEKIKTRIWTATECQICHKASKTATCRACSPHVKMLRGWKWTPGMRVLEDHRTFTKTATLLSQTIETKKHDEFRSTTISLSHPYKKAFPDDRKERDLDLPDMTTAGLDHEIRFDLAKLPVNAQRICLITLGEHDQRFDSWLRGRNLDPSHMRDTQIFREACSFYDVPRATMQRMVRPIVYTDPA